MKNCFKDWTQSRYVICGVRLTKQAIGTRYYSKTFAPIYLNFLLSVKAVTLIFISGRGSAISSAKQALFIMW